MDKLKEVLFKRASMHFNAMKGANLPTIGAHSIAHAATFAIIVEAGLEDEYYEYYKKENGGPNNE